MSARVRTATRTRCNGAARQMQRSISKGTNVEMDDNDCRCKLHKYYRTKKENDIVKCKQIKTTTSRTMTTWKVGGNRLRCSQAGASAIFAYPNMAVGLA